MQDYITGVIKQNDEIVSEIKGTYLGYLEFDGERYWDARDTVKFKISPSESGFLPSDSRFREDLSSYISGDVDEAQAHKEKMEQEQRHDAKLRGHH